MVKRTISNWFRESTPSPTKQNKTTQLGCHFEEVAEMLDTLAIREDGHNKLADAYKAMHELAEYAKANPGGLVIKMGLREEFLDSICDQVVTGIGCAVLNRMQVEDAIAEVNDSNWSKFVNGKPVRDEHSQKILKGPDYFKADLSKYI